MEIVDIIINHKLKKLHKFINCNNITVDELKKNSYRISIDSKCEKCHQDYLLFEKIKKHFNSVSKKKNISLKESISYLEKKGIINSDLIQIYNKFKCRFVNSIFDYCHNNTLISLKKLETLLKNKSELNYKELFNNIIYNYIDFYCCPYYEIPKKVINYNLSEINKYNKINKEVKLQPKEFMKDLIVENKEHKPIVWEKKKSNYVKTNNTNPKKTLIGVDQELEITYEPTSKYEIIDLISDFDYMKEKKELLLKKDQLEYFSQLHPYNQSIEQQIFEIHNILSKKYSDSYLIDSSKIQKKIIILINKHICTFNEEHFNDNCINIFNLNHLIKIIKLLKYNINYGKEIIEICNISNNNFSKKIIDKLNYYINLEKTLIKNYHKIKKGEDNIINISHQNLIHPH